MSPAVPDASVTREEAIVRANGLEHHVLRWVPERSVGAPVLLCHGFLDQGASWRWVAERLVAQDRLVLAFDWRGHGRSAWIGPGGYYHFPDYLLDLDELIPQLSEEPVHLVGHSMGGVAATMYAAVRPERVRSLVSLEGLGPEAVPVEDAPARARQWLEAVARVRARPLRPIASLQEAAQRMRLGNPELPEALFPELLEQALVPLEGGGHRWHFDPLHRTPSPMPFRTELFVAFVGQLRCPVLLVRGEHGHHPEDLATRLAAFPEGTPVVTVPGAGHMLHLTAPATVADHILAHVTDVERHSEPAGD